MRDDDLIHQQDRYCRAELVGGAFGNAIRAARNEQGISQEAFALKCGLDRSYYGAVERGERNVSLTNIVRIAEALDTPLATIFASAEAASPVQAKRR